MRASRFVAYGDPSGIVTQELPQPEPHENDLLVRVVCSTVTAGDTEIRRLKLPPRLRIPVRLYAGLRRPRRITTLGMELAGVVERVGTSVTDFLPGDEVFGATGFRFGAHAQFAALPAQGPIARKPQGVSFEEAATLPTGAAEALHFVRRAAVAGGDRVLVFGGSGSIGTFAIQLARLAGASVTATGNPASQDVMLELGAERSIDYTAIDFTTEDREYDVIIDAIGRSNLRACVRRLAPGGRFVKSMVPAGELIAGSRFNRKQRGRDGRRVMFGSAPEIRAEDLDYLARLVADGRLRVVIDRRYPLDEIARAHRYVDSGEKSGNVIITVG